MQRLEPSLMGILLNSEDHLLITSSISESESLGDGWCLPFSTRPRRHDGQRATVYVLFQRDVEFRFIYTVTPTLSSTTSPSGDWPNPSTILIAGLTIAFRCIVRTLDHLARVSFHRRFLQGSYDCLMDFGGTLELDR
jgi:hypothetical protein